MFLAKTDIAALLLHSFSAGVTSLLLVYAGVIGDGSTPTHVLSLGLFLVNGGTVLRILRRGRRPRSRRGPAPTRAPHAAQREGAEVPQGHHRSTGAPGGGCRSTRGLFGMRAHVVLYMTLYPEHIPATLPAEAG
jgi:hypothetical protein